VGMDYYSGVRSEWRDTRSIWQRFRS